MLIVLEVRLYKPAVYKLKIWGKGKIEYYKAMEGTKKKGRNQIFKVQWGSTIFDLSLVVGNALEETMI